MGGTGRAARACAALFVAAAVLHAAPRAAAAFRNVQEGTEAPAFRLKDLSGGEVSLDQFKSDKAVVLVFWATWSGRSVEELKDVQKLVAEFGAKGMKAVAVNVEHEHVTAEDVASIKAKVEEMKLTFPVALDAGLETFRGYGVVAVPSTAVLGEGGIIRSAFNGYPTSAHLEVRQQVETLLGLRKEEAGPVAAAAAPAYKPPRQALLNYNLGRRLYAFGMADKAEPKLAAAAAADPKWAAPRILLGEIAMAKSRRDPSKAEEAKKEFAAAAAAEPGNAVARTGLARAEWKLGHAAEAEKEVGEALARSASYPPALLLKAAILGKKGDRAGAEKAIAEALELNPKDPEAHAMAGRAYEEAGDLAKAAAMYRKAWMLNGE